MGKIKTVEVFRKSYVLDAAGTIPVDIPSDNMPSGLIHGFHLRLECAALSSFDSAVATYPNVVRSITYGAQFPKFNVMTGFPGGLWDAIWTMLRRKASSRTTPSSGGFAISYYLPFSLPGTDRKPAFRPKDSGLLNINNKALPFVQLLLGPYSDVAITLDAAPTVHVILEADYEPDPQPGFGAAGDQPMVMLEVSYKQKSDLSTNPIVNLLTGGLRQCLAIILRELNSATSAVVSDIFNVGVATPSKFEVVKGDTDGYTPRVKVGVLDARIADELGVALTAGYHAWIATREGRNTDAVNLADAGPFNISMDNLATTASRLLEVIQVNTIDIGKDVLTVHAQQLGVKA